MSNWAQGLVKGRTVSATEGRSTSHLRHSLIAAASITRSPYCANGSEASCRLPQRVPRRPLDCLPRRRVEAKHLADPGPVDVVTVEERRPPSLRVAGKG